MNKKFLKIVKRQSELAVKAADGTASEAEKTELKKLTAAVEAATAPEQDVPETTLKTMKLSDFRAWHEKAVKDIEDGGDDKLLALVKRNIAAVKDQAVTDPEGIVAVEIPIEKSESDRIKALETRIAELEDKGEIEPVVPADGDAAPTGKADKPTAQALAMEAVDTLLVRYTKLKAVIESGSFSKDDIEDLWGDWSLKDVIASAAAIMTKAEEMKGAVEAVMPTLEKLAKKEEDEGDPDPKAVPDPPPAPEGTQKSDSKWLSGGDMAPQATAEQQAAAIKANKEKHGY